jgi:two-component system sensor histidine kinase PilS (NtrC family)
VRHATDLLREYVQDEPGSLHLFRILERETLRIDRIIDSVLEMARPRPAHPEPIVLHSWLPVLLDQLAADPGLATLRIQLPKTNDGPVVFADPAHLRQVFANLLQNAAQHAGADAAEIPVEITWHATGDGTVEIRLRDHGPGIPEESMERIFEPFFTSDARGTGLGLSMVRELLRLNHGTIAARNHREGGAEFVLELPAWDGGKIQ